MVLWGFVEFCGVWWEGVWRWDVEGRGMVRWGVVGRGVEVRCGKEGCGGEVLWGRVVEVWCGRDGGGGGVG